MDEQSKLEKSTGFTPVSSTGGASASAPKKSTAAKKELPVLTTAPMKGAKQISTGAASGSKILAAQILAIQTMMGDYKALKKEAPKSWQTTGNGKIYWCASVPGHELDIVDGVLLVDGLVASRLLEKILAEGESE